MKIFTNVAALKLAKLTAGQLVETKGYYTAGDGGQARYLIVAPQAADEYGNHTLANSNVAVLQHEGAVNALWFGLIDSSVIDQTAILQSLFDYSSENNAIINIPSGTYRYTQLFYRIGMMIKGQGNTKTFLQAIDPLVGSSIIREDDTLFYSYGFIESLSIGTAFSGVATAQDNNQLLYGLNLIGVNRMVVRDVGFSGFGAGAIVLGRAENGTEGFGFVNSVRDGNHNRFFNITITSCGKYGPWEQSAIYGVYKANANHFYGITGNDISSTLGGRLIGIKYGGGNRFFGVTAESMYGIAAFGDLTSGNNLYGVYAENMTNPIKSYPRGSSSNRSNSLFGGNINTYSGPLVDDGGDPRFFLYTDDVIGMRFGNKATTNVAVNYAQNHVTAPLGFLVDDADGSPLLIRSKSYNSVNEYPRIEFDNSYATITSPQPIGSIIFNNDSSARGVAAQIDALAQGSGYGAISLKTGRQGNVFEALKVAPHVTVETERTSGGHVTPGFDNSQTLGSASNRWSTVYAGTGAINTSDEREKTFLNIEDAEKDAALEIKSNLRKFKFNDALVAKGDGARIHFGASAQQVADIMTKHGLNTAEYGFFCYDEWYEVDGVPVLRDEDTGEYPEGAVKRDRYGIRYEELLCFIMAAL